VEDQSWFDSCYWSLADEFARRKEVLTWHLKAEIFVVMGLGNLI